mmetsp:Transcript_25646/g.65914  ORF Transcript_25646/g.65914 Transcript_25646/m.65914 type:complete len:277 (-) Transcript_25646:41-871(-)
MATPAMNGCLFVYDPPRNLCGFASPKVEKKALVLIGGLTDGLMPTVWTTEITDRIAPQGWCTVQVLLQSSYSGYGIGSLDTDAEDLKELCSWLAGQGVETVVLLGHSTGCQDAVHVLRDGPVPGVKGIILQAPVSDRECMALDPGTSEALARAEALVADGKGNELLPRADHQVPITASRFCSLAGKGGPDDLFSSDLTDEELKAMLGHVTVPTLLVLSGADQYVPDHVDTGALAGRLGAAIGPHAKSMVIGGANHGIKAEGKAAFLEAVQQFVLAL